MDNIKVFLENGMESIVNGLFYIFNSKYYFIYTQGEILDNDYVQLYVVQVCKEVKNTPNGTVDTGYMLGVETKEEVEWNKVQQSITKIVEDKKNSVASAEIQYLPINMISNLKIISKNKFKLMKHIIEENFKVNLSTTDSSDNVMPVQPLPVNSIKELPTSSNEDKDDSNVIIDYRAKFFEEQEKNQQLEEQLKLLQEKLNTVKGILQ